LQQGLASLQSMAGHSARTIEWRFGGLPGDPEAWYAMPSDVHAYVDIRSPETPPGHWHRTWAVTGSWVERHVLGNEWAVVPPLLVIADGSPAEMRERVDAVVQGGWELIIRSAVLRREDQPEAEW
jgi:hypothetical protein